MAAKSLRARAARRPVRAFQSGVPDCWECSWSTGADAGGERQCWRHPLLMRAGRVFSQAIYF
eukprot:CAMPEP_0183362112 /NCGR_PEP_ID=MMETSP0164_2-20130417/66725_1 /TAXON_ID=221442 /ORGANISM="Coccolithus pelagicus ssp braarudi, Strain PLY182g" /LENGTH=61 /DNA_ID=CAMNT_0025536889 /DNA_START=17 /DNA_END=202 /DNA_ORIENTATION=-